MIVAIVDCGSGNLRSATRALEHAAADGGIRAEVVVTQSPEAVLAADRIVLPGQGAFASCLAGLNAVDGLRQALEEAKRAAAEKPGALSANIPQPRPPQPAPPQVCFPNGLWVRHLSFFHSKACWQISPFICALSNPDAPAISR